MVQVLRLLSAVVTNLVDHKIGRADLVSPHLVCNRNLRLRTCIHRLYPPSVLSPPSQATVNCATETSPTGSSWPIHRRIPVKMYFWVWEIATCGSTDSLSKLFATFFEFLKINDYNNYWGLIENFFAQDLTDPQTIRMELHTGMGSFDEIDLTKNKTHGNDVEGVITNFANFWILVVHQVN